MKRALSTPVPSLGETGKGQREHRHGQAVSTLGCEPAVVSGRPFDSSGCAASADP
jgi:hypothetical protein